MTDGATPLADTTLADLITAQPAAAAVFTRHGLDFCCGGHATLAVACRSVGIDDAVVSAELEALDSPRADWTSMGALELVEHIEREHHEPLRQQLVALEHLMGKVVAVHGDRHRELAVVDATFTELRLELVHHLLQEEELLFAAVREQATSPDTAPPVRVDVLLALAAEHDRTAQLMARIRTLTGGFRVPADGCASYRALYGGFDKLAVEMAMHTHKENNVLFPSVGLAD